MWVHVEYDNGEISFECIKSAILKSENQWVIALFGKDDYPAYTAVYADEQEARLKYSVIMAECAIANAQIRLKSEGVYFAIKGVNC